MKLIHIFLVPLLIFALVIPLSAVGAENGVDDLRGRWDVQWNFQGGDPEPQLILYINGLRASATLPNTYYANGCMRSPDTNALMPLSVRAVFDPVAKSYQVIFLSTFIPQDNEPFVIRLNGSIQPKGESVKDDQSQGTLITEFTTGQWIAAHHDRRETKCPSVRDSGLGFQGDVYVHRDLGYSTPRSWVLYEGHTVIVSSGMLVEAPDGTIFVVQEYTDIFSPDVDFVGRFRYLLHTEGLPIIGGVYKFSLLDIFGEPIPGTESTDIWFSCPQGAPSNIDVSYLYEDHALMTWDPVATVPDQFDPASQIGFYQIGISPFNWPGIGDYGSNGIAASSHVIPWNQFEPGTMGQPDGFDYGTALGSLQDGMYHVGLYAFGTPAPDVGGVGHECMTFDSSELFTMTKTGSGLSFEQMASISGRVTDDLGLPVSGAGVGACLYDEENPTSCYGDQTDANGNYNIFLPAGGYRVNGGGMEGWSNEFYNDTPDWNLASEVDAYSGLNTPNINFSLIRVTTISGVVYDENGNPLPNIAVDTEFGGYGTCTDENGLYALQNVPLGAHFNIVAGRDFCGEHPYAEQMIYDIVAGSIDVNFFLVMK